MKLDPVERKAVTISSDIIPSPLINIMPEIYRFCNPPADLVCPICKEFFERPVQSSCKHYFCYKCVLAWMEHACEISRCPVCTQTITTSTLCKVPRIFLNILSSLPVNCVSCKSIVPLDQLQSHESQCNDYVTQPCSTTLGEVLNTPMTTPLSGAEETLATHLMKRKMCSSESSQVVLKTGGSVSVITFSYWSRVLIEGVVINKLDFKKFMSIDHLQNPLLVQSIMHCRYN
jgi:hypothetical protein